MYIYPLTPVKHIFVYPYHPTTYFLKTSYCINLIKLVVIIDCGIIHNVFEDYTVNNISQLVSSSCAKLDELSIAEEIEAIESPGPRRRIVKNSKTRIKSTNTLNQTVGPIDTFFVRMKRQFSPEKKLGDSDQAAKQIREDIPGI